MPKRILIVDDSFDLTRVLKTAIHTLDKSIEVKIVPSAEEGLLEFSKEPLDFMISDILLPGISGLEYLRKVRKKNEDLKIIMITGLTDQDLEEKAKAAGADFFLRKPIEMPLFIDAVSSFIGIEVPENFDESTSEMVDVPIVPRRDVENSQTFERISDAITQIRGEIGAKTIYLLDENGKIAARSGENTIPDFDKKWLPVVLPLISSGGKMAAIDPCGTAQSIMAFKFQGQDLILMLLADYALLAVVSNKRGMLRFPLVIDSLTSYQSDLMAVLSDMGVIQSKKPTLAEQADSCDDSEEKEAVEDFDDLDDLDDDFDDEDLDSLVSLLESNGAAGEKEADPDQFWEKASEEVVYDLNNPDIISYEQAEKLGLTPDDEA